MLRLRFPGLKAPSMRPWLAIYGLASHGRMLGAFKPGNRSRDIRGLYLAGGAAHPGPGMPMVLMSGWIAADALDQDAIAARGAEPLRRSA